MNGKDNKGSKTYPTGFYWAIRLMSDLSYVVKMNKMNKYRVSVALK